MATYDFPGPSYKGRFKTDEYGDICLEGHDKWVFAYLFTTNGCNFEICRSFIAEPETHLKVVVSRIDRVENIKDVATFLFPINTPLEAIIQDVDCSLLTDKELKAIRLDTKNDILYYNNPDVDQLAAEGTMSQYVEAYIGDKFSMDVANVRRTKRGYQCGITRKFVYHI
jgi:hypothetical protein